VLQQTPSTQLPLAHVVPTVHAVPFVAPGELQSVSDMSQTPSPSLSMPSVEPALFSVVVGLLHAFVGMPGWAVSDIE
jgi:hypothetical protein